MISNADYRSVMSRVPTSVAVITATIDDRPIGMTVGTFTSVSLDPPLVAFFVDRSSTTWPKLAEAEHFGINILGAGAGAVCRAFARRGHDRFTDVMWNPSERGVPLLEQAIVTAECTPYRVDPVGDHLQVVARVENLEQRGSDDPLIFLHGGFVEMSTSARPEVEA